MRQLFNFMVGSPGRITALGSILGHVGFAFFVSGILSRIPGIVDDLMSSEGVKSLSQLFPYLPLWWLPESAPTIILAFLTMLAGIYVWTIGRRVDQLYEDV